MTLSQTAPPRGAGLSTPAQAAPPDRPPWATGDDVAAIAYTPDPKDPPTWHELAACNGADGDAFFPEKGGSTRDAKRICLGCEVRAECLEYALANQIRFGVWGGKSERERRRIRRRGGMTPAVATS
jgi:WhiB family redox-sensing transcriptional regulator